MLFLRMSSVSLLHVCHDTNYPRGACLLRQAVLLAWTCLHLSHAFSELAAVCCLQEPVTEWDTPRVSPYRLAAHLTSAVTIYGLLAWTSWTLLHPSSPAARAAGSTLAAGAARLRGVAYPLTALITLTAFSGGVHLPSRHATGSNFSLLAALKVLLLDS